MRLAYRILLVIIFLIAFLTLIIDYLEFHGSFILGKVANGDIVKGIDAIGTLFTGPNAFINALFMAIFGLVLVIVIMAVIYKFLKG